MPTTDSPVRAVTSDPLSRHYPLLRATQDVVPSDEPSLYALPALLLNGITSRSSWAEEIELEYERQYNSYRRRLLSLAALYSERCREHLVEILAGRAVDHSAIARDVASALSPLMRHICSESNRAGRNSVCGSCFSLVELNNRLPSTLAGNFTMPAPDGFEVKWRGYINFADLRFYGNADDASPMRLPSSEPACILSTWVGGVEESAAISSDGLMVVWRCEFHCSGTIVKIVSHVTHVAESIHPIALVARQAQRSIMLGMRRWADANNGRCALDGTILRTPLSRRAGMTAQQFASMFRCRRSLFAAAVRSTCPTIPRNWRSSSGLPASTRRNWNWTNIPAEVAAIMERDLNLHLEEPMENR